jgi:hypothetical protein
LIDRAEPGLFDLKRGYCLAGPRVDPGDRIWTLLAFDLPRAFIDTAPAARFAMP